GALGDIGAHIIDLTQHVTGQRITGVSATTRTFVPERPLSDNGAGTGKVTVDDAVAFTARFSGGALGTFEATRFANGRKNALRIEINGSQEIGRASCKERGNSWGVGGDFKAVSLDAYALV